MDAKVAGFDRDDGNWPKCAKHGVSKAEIEYVLSGEPRVGSDRTGRSEPRLNAIGRNAEGRHLFLVFAVREREGKTVLRPISARYMHQEEIDHYERG